MGNYDLAKSRANKLRQALTDSGVSCWELYHYETEDGEPTEVCFSVDLCDTEGNPVSVTFGFSADTGEICQGI